MTRTTSSLSILSFPPERYCLSNDLASVASGLRTTRRPGRVMATVEEDGNGQRTQGIVWQRRRGGCRRNRSRKGLRASVQRGSKGPGVRGIGGGRPTEQAVAEGQ